ncbi:MAG: serine hydrolase [Calditrichia bacterium]
MKFSSESIFFLIIIIFLASNRARVGSELPSKEIDLLHLVHQTIDAKKAVKIDSFFTARNKRGLFNGAVLVAEKGRVVYEKAFGYADFRKKTPLAPDSSFQLASVSKPLTATAVLMLAEEGRLGLEDDVRKFFPKFPYENVTVRLLLTHRSGLPDYMYFADKYWRDRHTPISNADVIRMMITRRPDRYYEPNRRYNYSNTNYCLLAAIIEKVSGMTFPQFMRTRIFKPLHMDDSWVYEKTEDSRIPAGVTGYNRRGRRAENSYLNGVVGDKGIYSTVEDLYKFDQALNEGRLVSASALAEAYKPAHPDLRIWDNYGFGWRINAADPAHKIIYHTGWWKGFKTYFIREIDDRKTIIVLTNSARIGFIPVRTLESLLL